MTQPVQTGRPGGAPGGLGLTTLRQAVIAAMAGMVVGWFIVGTLQAADRVVPVTPWSLVAGLLVMAVAGFVGAGVVKRTVETARASLSPDRAVGALVMGKTMLMTGAILAGGHLVYVLSYVGSWSAPTPRQRVVHGLATLVSSVLLGLAGRRLERACLVPPSDDEDPSQGSDAQ